MSPIQALHQPDIYSSPKEFVPDRWLNATPDQLKRMEAAFVPFGRGPRICMGIRSVDVTFWVCPADGFETSSLGYANLYHIVSSVCRRFEIQAVDTVHERDIEIARDLFVSKHSKASTGVKIRILREYK